MFNFKKIFIHRDKTYKEAIFISIGILFSLGLVATYDFSPAIWRYADGYFELDRFYFVKRQIAYLVVGLAIMTIGNKWPLVLERYKVYLFLGALVILFLPLFPSTSYPQYGANRWLSIGNLVVYSGTWGVLLSLPFITEKCTHIEPQRFNITRPPFYLSLSIFFVNVFLFIQPDEPVLLLFNLIVIAMIILLHKASLSKLTLTAFLIYLPTLIFFLFCFYLNKSGNLLFLENLWHRYFFWKAPWDAGYQTLIAMKDIKAGGLLGSGFGCYTEGAPYPFDTISRFSLQISAREFGLLGLLIILFLYGVLFVSLIKLIKEIKSPASKKLALSLFLFIFLQAFMGICRILNLLPFMPSYHTIFMGYGFNGTVTSLLAVGIIFGYAKNEELKEPF